MPAVTVTIITLNEGDRIADALASVSWADEVIVVDAGSKDDTCQIAATSGARVHSCPWQGYGRQKNHAAHLARNNHILNIDADERVTPGLENSVRSLPDQWPSPAFWIRRENHMHGRVIRHWPWAWDRQARLYDRRSAAFTEVPVHESLSCDRVTGLPGILLHHSYRSWRDLFSRQIDYARLWADDAVKSGRRGNLSSLLFRPAAAFWRDYLIRGHVLGGRLGYRMSRLAAHSTFVKYLLLLEAGRD